MNLQQSTLFREWGTFKKRMDAAGVQLSFANHLEYSLGKDQYTATRRDLYVALALAARDRMLERWVRTQQTYYRSDAKRVYYLSAEYLMGRLLVNNLISLGIHDDAVRAMRDFGIELADLAEEEPDAGLGNGGLGRLAACFLDSLASLEIPAYGYGIRYDFGIFEQQIRDQRQWEMPDQWLKFGNPWEIARPEYTFPVRFGGRVEPRIRPNGGVDFAWVDTHTVLGVAYDTPIDGYDTQTVNTLRLWSARASKEFDLDYFQHGDYLQAVQEKNLSENISKVLYPNDTSVQGQELRLKQQYFFVSCSLQDIVRRYRVTHRTFDRFADKVAIQLNDTHPALTIPELMRLLVDEHRVPWEQAWDLTVRTCAYTNHTLLAEALEKWPIDTFGRLLPRHLQIVYEINHHFLRDVAVLHPDDPARLSRMSIIQEEPHKAVRMAHLAIVGSHSVNGVAALHTKLLRERELREFDELFPDRFHNKTNGVTPRRWLLAANPELSALIRERIGDRWPKDLSQLRGLETAIAEPGFRERFRAIKRGAKERLARVLRADTGWVIDPVAVFDVQIKRIHEYKRQLLNLLHAIHWWLRLKHDRSFAPHPRLFLLGGKAAPGYAMAKSIIRLACAVGDMVNRDPAARGRLWVVFAPNYRVSLAEKIIPASDVSEQISTAGFEASGTGNMKFAMNGALLLGTLDGANVEIVEEVGADNAFVFGLTADEVQRLRPSYVPKEHAERDPVLAEALRLVREGCFTPDEPEAFRPLVDVLLHRDPFFVLADFEAYRQAQLQVDRSYRDADGWSRKALLNVARSGKFSSDRTIQEYNRDVWGAAPVPVPRSEESSPPSAGRGE